ncbi:hypothetical protein [Brachybacterium saurashtrense]|uniref:Anti-sigma factor n=1 Tax=Brachybacterium saurashtrense TaxID=556288 RepID=A0A345YL99_9MICO|nr:hypothetical protein [Brachybacterium saurashtrense]AXK44701.1 hypothetical protein DWV08_03040 [Brachybacterium saurashtrense]RRR23313.1 hypothetical protein DXU92_08170 [Brachybacterium saurashtrense]
MGSEAGTGEMPAIPEDTIDLGLRVDPLRTLLRRTAGGDQRAAAALVDVLGARVHGLAVHMTGSAARAEKLTVSVLRSCLRDAAELAASGLPGEAAVLDRARRAAVATHPRGDVRSLAGPGPAEDRTSDRREAEVLRVLLELPPAGRALVESAAQGRFAATGQARRRAAVALADVLEALVPLGGPRDPETRGLGALDALALADVEERRRLRELTGSPETAGIHRHAIEAAARLALLTAVPPSRDLRPAVLEGFVARPAPSPAEPAYGGTYATPVLGTDSQRRRVGPPAHAGMLHPGGAGGAAATPDAPGAAPQSMGLQGAGLQGAGQESAEQQGAPVFAFRAADEKQRSRRSRRARRREARRPGPARASWVSRSAAVLGLLAVAVLSVLLLDAHRDLDEAREFSAGWVQGTMAPDARLVHGISDNGTWQAVLSEEGVALRAEGVAGHEGEVLELWSDEDGTPRSLGVLELSAEGTVEFLSPEQASSLFVTREMAPGSGSGAPSSRMVATLEPADQEPASS